MARKRMWFVLAEVLIGSLCLYGDYKAADSLIRPLTNNYNMFVMMGGKMISLLIAFVIARWIMINLNDMIETLTLDRKAMRYFYKR